MPASRAAAIHRIPCSLPITTTSPPSPIGCSVVLPVHAGFLEPARAPYPPAQRKTDPDPSEEEGPNPSCAAAMVHCFLSIGKFAILCRTRSVPPALALGRLGLLLAPHARLVVVLALTHLH